MQDGRIKFGDQKDGKGRICRCWLFTNRFIRRSPGEKAPRRHSAAERPARRNSRCSRRQRYVGHIGSSRRRGIHFLYIMETESLPETLPEGMISYQAPALTYAQTRHPQHERPEVTYQKVYQWIKDQGLRLNCDAFTQLEFYPMDGDLNELAFEIYIPIH